MIDDEYKKLVTNVLANGEWSENRTGIRTKFVIGHHLSVDCGESFPLLTTKRVFYKSAFAEMLGFIRGYTSAADFRKIGCNVWDANANENAEWLNNPNRYGEDDMGLVYGYQWRSGFLNDDAYPINQLHGVIEKLSNDIDDRRLIVTAWNPEDFPSMCLLPCHYSMQFSLTKQKTTLNLAVNQRSWDVFLGAPFNIAQYAFLLHLIAKMTNKEVGRLHFFANNVHVYENHMDQIKEQMSRVPVKQKPVIQVNPEIDNISYLEDESIGVDDLVEIKNYHPHPAIKATMAV